MTRGGGLSVAGGGVFARAGPSGAFLPSEGIVRAMCVRRRDRAEGPCGGWSFSAKSGSASVWLYSVQSRGMQAATQELIVVRVRWPACRVYPARGLAIR